MGWLLLLASVCMFVVAVVFTASAGASAEKKDVDGLQAALIIASFLLLAAMALLFAAGMQFGGKQ